MGPAGGGASFPASPSSASGPTSTSVAATGPIGAPATGSGTALAENGASISPATVIVPPGLIALSVAPIGSLSGNAGAFTPASAQAAFTLPNQTPSSPSLAGLLVQMLTATQALGLGDAPGPGGAQAEAPIIDVGGPALVFDEALARLAESSPLGAGDGTTVATLDPASGDLPAGEEGQDATVQDKTPLAAAAPLPAKTCNETAEEARVEVRLAWGLVLGTIVSIPLFLIKRHRSARCSPSASLGRGWTASCTGVSTKADARPAAPMAWRNPRSQRIKSLLWKRTRTTNQGLHS
jgi:hypothetical protein